MYIVLSQRREPKIQQKIILYLATIKRNYFIATLDCLEPKNTAVFLNSASLRRDPNRTLLITE
jgi:hypothetical protein